VEYKLHDTHQHIPTPSAIDEEMKDQPRLNRYDPEEEELLWHQRLAYIPSTPVQERKMPFSNLFYL
jgi:hypothetical protein